MHVDYVDHLPGEFIAPALDLYFKALEDKLAPIFGTGEKAKNVVASHIATGNCFTAVSDGILVGVMGIQSMEKKFLNPNFTKMLHTYGTISGMFRMGGLTIFHHGISRDEWYIDGIAVEQGSRGKGIGTGLMGFMEKTALKKGIQKITLEVINTNPGALNLYKRLGFILSRQEDLWPLNQLFGFPFESSFVMRKNIKPEKEK